MSNIIQKINTKFQYYQIHGSFLRFQFSSSSNIYYSCDLKDNCSERSLVLLLNASVFKSRFARVYHTGSTHMCATVDFNEKLVIITTISACAKKSVIFKIV
ncbi:Hypothetical_protein [Hexamita inflata]|uniref:Hypothetical_protein n=1 Tax=Hexamita inflata TaxID=28002 RepID=A0ABP1IKC0_9EUKA